MSKSHNIDAKIAAEDGDLEKKLAALEKRVGDLETRVWKLIGTAKGSGSVSFTDEYKELLLVARCDGNVGTVNIPVAVIDNNIHLVTGGYWADTNAYGVYFAISPGSAYLQSFYLWKKDNVANSTFALYGR